MEAIYAHGAAAVLTYVLVEVIKAAGLRGRWLPPLAVALGVAAAFVADPRLPWQEEVVTGVVIGATAGGLSGWWSTYVRKG